MRLAFLIFVSLWGGCFARDTRPNIVVFLVDDLGYGDLSSYGNKHFTTPNIDQLAAEGTKFTSWYAPASLCTPSRTGLLSGRFPVRSGMEGSFRVFYATNQHGGLPTSTVTLPKTLKSLGYTTGMTGKWHQGVNRVNNLDATSGPHNQGFDYGGLISPLGNFPSCAVPNMTIVASQCFFQRIQATPAGPLTLTTQMPWNNKRLATRMETEFNNFINLAHQADKPFFWYHSFLHVHTPLGLAQAGPYAGKSGYGLFGDEVLEVDGSIGSMMNTIKRLPRETLVYFLSDNGAWLEEFTYGPNALHPSSSGPLRGGKSQTWEGGHRVPAIVWWPGTVTAGRVTDEIASSLDIYATSVSAAGGNATELGLSLDGKDLLPYLKHSKKGGYPPWKNEILPFFCGTHLIAARFNQYKIHYKSQNFRDTTIITNPVPTPTSKCNGECCPYLPSNFGADPYCQCDTDGSLTDHTAQPLLFNLDKDIHEDHPLTPQNFPQYHAVVAKITERVAALKATINETVVNQIDDPVSINHVNGYYNWQGLVQNRALQPCCPRALPNGGLTCSAQIGPGGVVTLLPCNTDPNP